MTQLPIAVVDVFTDRALSGGNPLGVVLVADAPAEGVPDGPYPTRVLQAVAAELGFSESTFVTAVGPGASYAVRIFTPVAELPFAGHPSVGTAWVLARRGLLPVGEVVQRCGAGEVGLLVEQGADNGPGRVRLTGAAPSVSEPLDVAPLLAAVGLGPEDAAGEARAAGTGLEWAFVPVRPEALARATPDVAALEALSGVARGGVCAYVLETGDGEVRVRSRAFCPDVHGGEDAATGSAALGLGVHLVATGAVPGDGATDYAITQGVEMGRPSALFGRVEAADGRAVRCSVAGDVAPVLAGELTLP
ncbi:MAG: PhzF family phenazine biosynthesis protein [Motilibacteraceae bacterium]